MLIWYLFKHVRRNEERHVPVIIVNTADMREDRSASRQGLPVHLLGAN